MKRGGRSATGNTNEEEKNEGNKQAEDIKDMRICGTRERWEIEGFEVFCLRGRDSLIPDTE